MLLILGEKDNTGKVSIYNQQWAKRTGFALKIVEKAAHNSNVDQPDKVNMEIQEFLYKI